MLFDKKILNKLEKKLGDYPQFNIHIFLGLLQQSTRPFGYPAEFVALKDAPDSHCYFHLINNKINSAAKIRNAFQLRNLLGSLYQVMVSFCYLHTTLGDAIDNELLELFFLAIEHRAYTTDEERAAEKCFLLVLLKNPEYMLMLIAKYSDKLLCVDINTGILRLITTFIAQKKKEDICSLDAVVPKDELYTAAELRLLEQNTKRMIGSISEFLTWANCELVIGRYLLKIKATYAVSFPFLQRSIAKAEKELELESSSIKVIIGEDYRDYSFISLREKAKLSIARYIDLRTKEERWYNFFSIYPKAIKLAAAKKCIRHLNNEKISFTTEEFAALKDDKGSRLSSIYERYVRILSPTT